MILFSLLMFMNILVYSPDSIDVIFNFRTCYKSISHPNLQVELLHKLPSSPVYLEILTEYQIFFLSRRIPRIFRSARHHFKRISGTCQSSLIYTTKGKSFKKLKLNIYLFHTVKNIVHFSKIIYEFYPGFSSGIYLLVDMLSNFGLSTQIRKFGYTFFQKTRYSVERTLLYLQSVEWTDQEICIFTDNSEAIVIKPLYFGSPPYGLINQIKVDGYTDGTHVSSIFLTAFRCYSEEDNPNESVVLFKEVTETQTRFFAQYTDLENSNSYKYKEFLIPGAEWEDINNYPYYSEKSKKIDLTHNKEYTEACCDRSIRLYFVSKKGTVYYSRKMNFTEADKYVERWESTYIPPLAACCA